MESLQAPHRTQRVIDATSATLSKYELSSSILIGKETGSERFSVCFQSFEGISNFKL